MPAGVVPNASITPHYRLPENAGRRAEGGRRLYLNEGAAGRQTPLISVVTVVLNGEAHLEKTIQSVVAQLDERIEYIIIDGGSTDSTLEIIRKYDKTLEYWVSEPDQGISDAFNKGIALCRSRVVGILNSGDWYEPESLSLVQKRFQENSEIGVLCGALQYWMRGRKAYCSESRPELLGREMSVTHPTCFVNRELYLRYGGFDPACKFAMDYELLLRLYVHGVVFKTTSQVLAHMMHEGVSEQNWKKALLETWKARRTYLPGTFFAGRLYLWYLIGRKLVRFALQALAMHGVVRFYREKLAPVKKKLSV